MASSNSARDSGSRVLAGDHLAKTLDDITIWLAANGLRTFWGAIEPPEDGSGLGFATWDGASHPDWRDYLTLAKDLGVEVIFIEKTPFELDEFLRDRELPRTDEVQSLVDALRSHDREIGVLELQWVWGSVVMRFVRLATWYPDLRALEQLSPDQGDDGEEGDGYSLGDEEVEGHALTLAKDEVFQAARTNAQRRYAAKKVFADKPIELLDMARILEAAQSIYELDIKPKQVEELSRRIEQLKESGATRAQIAKQLGLTSEKVKDLGG